MFYIIGVVGTAGDCGPLAAYGHGGVRVRATAVAVTLPSNRSWRRQP